jgi:hypothetical protein
MLTANRTHSHDLGNEFGVWKQTVEVNDRIFLGARARRLFAPHPAPNNGSDSVRPDVNGIYVILSEAITRASLW